MGFLFVVALASAAANRVAAHHSWSADYDVSRSISISGTLVRVTIRNPHSALVLNVNDGERQERWVAEWGSPQRLRDRGITTESLRVGDELFVTGNPSRDPKERSLHALSVRGRDGAELGEAGRSDR
jgi:hypothetical protein